MSGAMNYQELCMAARNEKQHQFELKKRRLYQLPTRDQERSSQPLWRQWSAATQQTNRQASQNINSNKQCYNCRKLGHLAKDCRVKSTESKVQGQSNVKNSGKNSINRQVSTSSATISNDYLHSESVSEDEGRVGMVRNEGSQIQCAEVFIQRVSAEGLVDNGAEIIVMGGELFKKWLQLTGRRRILRSQIRLEVYRYGFLACTDIRY